MPVRFFLKIKSHANRDNVQTCSGVKCQHSTLPNSPSALHCISHHHHHVNLAKSSVVGLPVCSPRSCFSCHCSSGKSLISNKNFTGSCEWFTSIERTLPWHQLKVSQTSRVCFMQLFNWVTTSVLVISGDTVPSTVL